MKTVEAINNFCFICSMLCMIWLCVRSIRNRMYGVQFSRQNEGRFILISAIPLIGYWITCFWR